MASRPAWGVLEVALFAIALTSTPAAAFRIGADLDRDGNGNSGPSEIACSIGCASDATSVSVSFSGGFPPPSNPVVPPGTPVNSEISGNARVDLATGAMRGRAHAASFGHFETHEMTFGAGMQETIDITLPAGLPASERFATFIGTVHAGGGTSGLARISAIYVLDVGTSRAAAAMEEPGVWDVISGSSDANITAASLANGVRFEIRRAIPGSGRIDIESQLTGTAWAQARISTGVGIATVNAANTATLQMILPAGATFESTSGVFLTTPIPEPHAWALMLAGLGLVAAIARRRARA